METSILSIVIPVYRVEKYLKKCVNSFVSQITSGVELILVDDGSDDLCPSICDEYSSKYNFIRTIHKENGGLSSAVAVGVKNSSGKYIGFCDSDDWVTSDYLKEIMTIITSQNVDVLCFDHYRIQEWDKMSKISTSYLLKRGLSIDEGCESAKKTFMRPGGISPNRWTKIIKREFAISSLETYDIRISIGEDINFTAPIINRVKSIYYLDKALINYNVNRQSMTQNFNYKYIQDFDFLFLALEVALNDNRDLLGYINYINMRTMVNAIGKSSIDNKRRYLHTILSNSKYQKRLSYVSLSDLKLQDKLLLFAMKKNISGLLLIVSYLYRKLAR